MNDHASRRRAFLRQSAFLGAAAAIPLGFAAGALLPPNRRQEWQAFKSGPHYNALLLAIQAMKANTDPADPDSWTYWTNIHVNACPHGIAYFLGWHRGYLYHFEQKLRAISGDAGLVLPYWDYYADATLPAEFTDPRAGNPLYVERVNTDVSAALTLAPFSPFLLNFQRGLNQAFEPSFEGAPHNPVHDIIGGAMTTMESPLDPIFWLHHANVDRLWVAWVAAAGGRKMPAKSSSYWSGSHAYTATLTMPRTQTYDTRTNLAYYYQNESMPTALPAPVNGAGQGESLRAPSPPAVATFSLSNPRATGASTFSAVGALNVGLDERSVSVQLPPGADLGHAIAQLARSKAVAVAGSTPRYQSVLIVLDQVLLTPSGARGGYFYNVYLNLPGARNARSGPASALIGTLGPFKVSGAAHHRGAPAQLRYVVTGLVAGMTAVQVSMLTISFVRVNGANRPAGTVIDIGEVRLELSNDDADS
jgi:tyrosinase